MVLLVYNKTIEKKNVRKVGISFVNDRQILIPPFTNIIII